MIYWLAALTLLILAITSIMYSLGFNNVASTTHRLTASVQVSSRQKLKRASEAPIFEWLQKHGFSSSPSKNILLLGLLIAIDTGVYYLLGGLAALMAWGALIAVSFSIAHWRRANIRLKITQQLPSFIDQVNRRIKVGMSIHQAVEQSSSATASPLKHVLERVNQRRGIGIELQDAFYKEGTLTGVHSFRLLGSIFSINTRYGGSISDSLHSLVQLLRQQDLSRRELKSITGETRITAWVIGAAPVLVGAYMMAQSPELIIDMWYSEKGRYALLLGAGMQTCGVLIIWRMFRTL
ncbi:type II secretion system F family protein [Vibrio olivae]|uniref:Type II secretion system F family protein n=1 Tax=Vibrio olivae TaxID=1243002 RepID=A0ABV5HM77_9VIBR